MDINASYNKIKKMAYLLSAAFNAVTAVKLLYGDGAAEL